MGHDWVLTKTARCSGGCQRRHGRGAREQLSASRATSASLPPLKIVGGGEKAVVTFNTSQLERGVSYSYFCSAPAALQHDEGPSRLQRREFQARLRATWTRSECAEAPGDVLR